MGHRAVHEPLFSRPPPERRIPRRFRVDGAPERPTSPAHPEGLFGMAAFCPYVPSGACAGCGAERSYLVRLRFGPRAGERLCQDCLPPAHRGASAPKP